MMGRVASDARLVPAAARCVGRALVREPAPKRPQRACAGLKPPSRRREVEQSGEIILLSKISNII